MLLRPTIWLTLFVLLLHVTVADAASWVHRLTITDPSQLKAVYVNDSVDPISGTYYEEQVDLVAAGQPPLTITRVYGPQPDQSLAIAPGWWLKLDPRWDCLYDSQGTLLAIRSLSPNRSKLANWIRFHRTDDELILRACDGTSCRYQFNRLEGRGPAFLSRVEQADGTTVRYDYQSDPLTGTPRLIRREDSNGSLRINEYSDGSNQVIRQWTSMGNDSPPILAFHFDYQADRTTADNAEGNRTLYYFSGERLLNRVETYFGDTLYRSESFQWEGPHLTSYSVSDGNNTPLFCRTFRYDDWGNRIDMALVGDLSGNGEMESYGIRYCYSKDEQRQLLAVSEDHGPLVTFRYHANTGQLSSKFLWDGAFIRHRLFCDYDDDGDLIQLITDDGCSEDCMDLREVSERHITTIVPRKELPQVGLPVLVDEKYLDLETGIEHIMRTTLRTYDALGHLVREEFFNRNANTCGCLEYSDDSFKGYLPRNDSTTHGPATPKETRESSQPVIQTIYDTLDRPITIIDASGAATHKRYNSRGQPIEIIHPDGTHESFRYYLDGSLKSHKNCQGGTIDYIRDPLGRVVEEQLVSEYGERFSRHAAYNGFQLIGTMDSRGHETIYSYDPAGRLTSRYMHGPETDSVHTFNYQKPSKLTILNPDSNHTIGGKEDSTEALDSLDEVGDIVSAFVDSLNHDLCVLTDIQEQALLIGTQLIGPRTWDIIGFYATDPESGVIGNGEVSDKIRFSHINGIQNTREDSLATVHTISELHGNANIHYTYRPTAGWTWDFINACLVKVGYTSPTAYCLSQLWKELIEEMGGPDGGGVIIHYAHSLGGAETDCARYLLTPEEQKLIRVFTFGSPVLLPSEGFQGVTNYVSRLDPVCLIDPVRYLQGFFNHDQNVVFVGSYWGIPLLDHILVSSSYRMVLEQLGQEYGLATTIGDSQMERNGVEPLTSTMPLLRSTN